MDAYFSTSDGKENIVLVENFGQISMIRSVTSKRKGSSICKKLFIILVV
jgi:hypothetical protein